MIEGLNNFTLDSVSKMEQEHLKAFWQSDDPTLSDAINYYFPIFLANVTAKKNQKYLSLSSDDKNDVVRELNERFQTAMNYAFIKGHQQVYFIILPNVLTKITFKKDFFEDPKNRSRFLGRFFASLPTKIYQELITKKDIFELMKYCSGYFENSLRIITDMSKIFFTKGASIAYDEIRRDVVKVDYHITGYSKLLNAPYNQSFDVTPSFVGTFDVEHLDYESWDIRWNETYSQDLQNTLVGKLIVNRFQPEEVKAYAGVGAETYESINQFYEVNRSYQDTDSKYLYQAQMIFSMPDGIGSTRTLIPEEYEHIKISLRDTLCRRLHVRRNKIFVTI